MGRWGSREKGVERWVDERMGIWVDGLKGVWVCEERGSRKQGAGK